ncbi:MAG: aspartate/glutamate racemase family protein [Betaproteobacteria bacterium]|nr:aspartate/glutamate racemase family protein [Betaproteobacteria bacterium]
MKDLKKGFGWRGRVGLIMPATQTVSEPLFYAAAPRGISFHTSRLLNTGAGPEAIAETESQVERALGELKCARVQCIAYLCVTGGLVRGLEAERRFCREVEERHGVPVVSALLSAFEALKVLKMRKLVITGPYPEEHDRMERKLFEDNGFEVLGIHGMGITDGFEFGQVPSAQIYEFCRRNWNADADGLFVGCAAFNAMPIADRLEKELKAPVVTAHSAVLWKTLVTLGVDEPLTGYGRLLARQY